MAQNQPVPSCDVRTASERLNAGTAAPAPLIVDVRERDEFAVMRVPGAALVPLSGFAESWSTIPRDRPLLMMCAAGSRSLVATDFLRRQGYADVTNVVGGITAWSAAGLPVVSGTPGPTEGELPAP